MADFEKKRRFVISDGNVSELSLERGEWIKREIKDKALAELLQNLNSGKISAKRVTPNSGKKVVHYNPEKRNDGYFF